MPKVQRPAVSTPVQDQPTEVRLLGKIVRVLPERGFGFLADADGQEYFFHGSDLQGYPDHFSTLRVGWKVQFTPTTRAKGRRAEEVTVQKP